MAEITTLPITGYAQEPVPNKFLRQHGETEHLAILLPGMGYTCDMPLFYYIEFLLLELGADVLRVDYAYNRHPDIRAMSQDDVYRRLITDVSAAVKVGLAQRTYRDVTFVGKSLGTLAMGHLLSSPNWSSHTPRAVWLTPILNDEQLRERMKQHSRPSFLAIGTADHFYDVGLLDEVWEATQIETVIVEEADHSLNIGNDVAGSVQSVGRVVVALQRWLMHAGH
jgi:predicted alpha/beta-hydrolase family hydrolase